MSNPTHTTYSDRYNITERRQQIPQDTIGWAANFALDRIMEHAPLKGDKVNPLRTTPQEGKPYEWHVASLVCTMLKNAFRGRNWIITPELSITETKLKPDFVVENIRTMPNAGTDVFAFIHLAVEIKSANGLEMEQAFQQVVFAVESRLPDEASHLVKVFHGMFIVVQRGIFITFFELHCDKNKRTYESVDTLNELNIPNFYACTSLTQEYMGKPAVLVPGENVLCLSSETKGTSTKDEVVETRKQAKKYDIACVFNYIQHAKEISFLFDYMANNEARTLCK